MLPLKPATMMKPLDSALFGKLPYARPSDYGCGSVASFPCFAFGTCVTAQCHCFPEMICRVAESEECLGIHRFCLPLTSCFHSLTSHRQHGTLSDTWQWVIKIRSFILSQASMDRISKFGWEDFIFQKNSK